MCTCADNFAKSNLLFTTAQQLASTLGLCAQPKAVAASDATAPSPKIGLSINLYSKSSAHLCHFAAA